MTRDKIVLTNVELLYLDALESYSWVTGASAVSERLAALGLVDVSIGRHRINGAGCLVLSAHGARIARLQRRVA